MLCQVHVQAPDSWTEQAPYQSLSESLSAGPGWPNLMLKNITGEKSGVYVYEPEPKQQSSLWKSPHFPRLKKARQARSKTKSMPIVLFYICRVVQHEFVPEGQLVNAKFYSNILRHLREDIPRKQHELWDEGNWVLHHDNAPSHTEFKMHTFLSCNNMISLLTPVLAGFDPLWLLPLLQDEAQAEWSLFWYLGGDPAWFTEGAWHAWAMWLPKSVQTVTEVLGVAYCCTTGLL